jgi:hypothetical protein
MSSTSITALSHILVVGNTEENAVQKYKAQLMPISTGVFLSVMLVKNLLKSTLVWVFIERKRCKKRG